MPIDPSQSILDWLVEELKSKYGIRKDIGEQWLEKRLLLPMLDGLDEVKVELQESCVSAINFLMLGDFRPAFIVVCSRTEEYANYKTQLNLNGAIRLKSLKNEQIQAYLSDVGISELYQLLDQDLELLDLVRTPLLLSITILSHAELSFQKWHELTSTKQRVSLLLDAYISAMFSRKIYSRAYEKYKTPSTEQVKHYLNVLAKSMQHESQSEFLIEKMQPETWLSGKYRGLYRINFGLIWGVLWLGLCGLILIFGIKFNLIFSGIIGIVFLLIVWKSSGLKPFLFFELVIWLITGTRLFLPFKLMFGIYDELISELNYFYFDSIHTVEKVNLSLNRRSNHYSTLSIQIIWLISCFLAIFSLLRLSSNEKAISMAFGLVGVSSTIILSTSLHVSEVDIKTHPNQGILASLSNALIISIIAGLLFGFSFSLMTSILGFLEFVSISSWLTFWLSLGLFWGCMLGMEYGFKTLIQHINLRTILFLNGSIPWDYARFLNYCKDRLFFQRVGGRYLFIHRLLQEHFAEMEI